MLATFLKTAVIVAGALAALKLLVVWAEPRLAFRPSRPLGLRPDGLGIKYREYRIRTSDGEDLLAWRLEAPDPSAEVVFFHGNAGNLSSWCDLLEQIRQQGLTVTALDYRGYGDSSGTPSEQGLYRDVEAFLQTYWNEIRQQGLPVVYWGRSLGGPVAGYAVQQREPHGLILEATFPSKDSLLDHSPLFKLLSPFSRYRFPTAEFLQGRRCPTLLVHGDRDPVVPFVQGEVLFKALAAPKEFYRVGGAGHNDTQQVGGQAYWRRLAQFIREIREHQ